MADFRNTKYCKELNNVKNLKDKLKKEIQNKHPQIKDFYSLIRQENGEYKKDFLHIFNNKCVYCGSSTDILPITLFEIDHYVNKASFKEQSQANVIENLVPACKKCNRGKSGITVGNDYLNMLDPEGDEIKEVFYRGDDFRIYISPRCKNDGFIKLFYKAIKFDDETRRIDYLLLNLIGLRDKLDLDAEIKYKLGDIIFTLLRKRNIMP